MADKDSHCGTLEAFTRRFFGEGVGLEPWQRRLADKAPTRHWNPQEWGRARQMRALERIEREGEALEAIIRTYGEGDE